MSRINDILNRIKEISGLRTDTDVAKKLGLKPNTLAERKARDSIPYEEILQFCLQNEIYLDWVLTGTPPKLKVNSGNVVSESPEKYEEKRLESDPYNEKLGELKHLIETTKKISQNYDLGLNDAMMTRVLDIICVHNLSDDGIRDLFQLLSAVRDFYLTNHPAK